MTQTPVGTGAFRLQKEQSDRWRRGQARGSNGIWPAPRGCADPTQLAEFIYSEYCLRLELQETPSPEEYYRRFPTVVEPLRRLFESRKANPAKAVSVPQSPPEFASLQEIPAKVVSGTEPKTPAAGTLHPQTPRDPVRVPPRPVEMTTSGTVSGDTDANVTQAGTRDRSDTVVSTLEELYSGQVFGRYELIQELGRGGMGVVWKARDVDLDRFVAIKLILPNHVESEVGIKRFQAEARASASRSSGHRHGARLRPAGREILPVHGLCRRAESCRTPGTGDPLPSKRPASSATSPRRSTTPTSGASSIAT